MNDDNIAQRVFENGVEVTRMHQELTEEREGLLRAFHTIDTTSIRPAVIRLAEIDTQLEALKQARTIVKRSRREHMRSLI
jgi:hypothetical protein